MLQRTGPKRVFPVALGVLVLALAMAVAAPDRANAGCVGATTTFQFGDTVTESCTFDGNMTRPTGITSHGLIVGASDITIDGAGYSLDGDVKDCKEGEDNDAGIYSVGKGGVTIKNLEILNFCHGIDMQGAGPNVVTGNTIESCTIHDNGDDTEGSQTQGIKWNRVAESLITGCTVYNQGGDSGASGPPGGFGIYLCSGDDNEWSYNEVYGNLTGMFLRCSPERAWLHHNHAHDNPFGGIRANCVNDRDFLLEYNNCSNNTGGGESSSGLLGGYGIFFGGADSPPNNVARYNTCQWNRIGISFERSAYVGELYENISCENTEWDIYVQDGAVVTGDENTCDTAYNYNDDGTLGCTYACEYPMAKFYADPVTACTGENVFFSDLSLADPDIGGCAIASWSWDVDGDGNEDYNTQNPVHAYADSGIYDVSLTVTQGGGCSGSDTEEKSAYITICPYKGDFDTDTDVDGSDMYTFYHDCLQAGTPPAWCDVNGDGSINAADMDNLGRADCVFCP